jgi:MYXO-CTERM domain-containing protein
MYCHSWGATYGLSTAGTFLFSLDLTWPKWLIETKLRGFIVAHSESLGLAPGLTIWHLGLAPHHRFSSNDAVVTVIATKRGALGIRGAIVDSREVYDHVDAPSSKAQAEVGLLARMAERLQVSPDSLGLRDLRLVAFPRLKKLGWAAEILHGMPTVGTAVLEADPTPAEAFPPLMYFDSPIGEGLADETPIEVRADDPSKDPVDGVVESTDRMTLYDGSMLQGSTNGPSFVLGTERVFVADGSGFTDFMNYFDTPALTSPTMQFLSPVGTPEFRAQDSFAIVSDMYARTDLIMAGKWDSALGANSLFPPAEFAPRVAVWQNAPGDTCEFFGASEGSTWCAGGGSDLSGIDPALLTVEYQQPLGGVLVDGVVTYEPLGAIRLEGSSITPAIQTHEFGHFVDFFATPGLLDSGFGCKNCPDSCVVGSTDEVGSLMESWAQFASLWYFRELYEAGAQSSSCDIPGDVSLGTNDLPHNDACRPDGRQYALFLRKGDPGCPEGPMDIEGSICDRPGPENAGPNTGLCQGNYGYRVNSFFNPLWELLHGETCATDPPYTCTPLPTLAALPTGDVVGRALLFALRVNSATYEGFAEDMGLYISCNHGPAAFAEFNAVFCHHALQQCGQSSPAGCCGNGSRENSEDCDGDDLSGFTCADVGFDGGVLSCTDDCELDTSQCTSDVPTSSDADTGVPTTTATTTASGTGTGTESVTAEGGADGGGCSCAAHEEERGPSSWLLSAAVLALFRRSKRRIACAAALVSLPLASACGPTTGGEASSGGGTETSLSPSTSVDDSTTTGVLPEAFRRFGVFHQEQHKVSYQNPPDKIFIWSLLDIREDGSLTTMWRPCTGAGQDRDFTWEHIEGGAIRVVPNELLPGGTFRWYANEVVGVTISKGPGCDDIMMSIDYDDSSGQLDMSYRYVPGALCAEGTDCDFTFVWCDGKGPPVCE